ncbi:MFS transporter [Mycobacterium sp. Root265]|uniref:thiamine pyrophosphate-dependent enzyme n=1 Tax=Mycobacterium sp. Root265 TaxID=1736504 RepID=UPI00070E73E7|nr:thiamine pyrophosphate-dependent enzyme [Mycobacterium sp. Root265]KRD17060.1 MFS transporter [Mycobacterium sp. Root265]
MVEPIDTYFLDTIAGATAGPGEREQGPLGDQLRLDLFDAQLGSRHLDLVARWLRSKGKGFYTIGSSGHEGNAAVAAALRPTDPALLHYRSGGFFVARAQQVIGSDPLRDVLLGLVAATEEPIAGGRHKVFGRRDLNIIPQTSTIASHLPRAVGVAFSIARTRKLGVACPWPADALAVCSFGDASVNHSTAVGAINTAVHTGYQGVPLPLLFVCEDNGIGISVKSPPGWIAANYAHRTGLEYFSADGSDLAETYAVTAAAAQWVRAERRPAFLHLRTVRLMAHAGSDFEPAYRSPQEIAADYDRDPVLCTALDLVERGLLTSDEVLERYQAKRARVLEIAAEVVELEQLGSAETVMRPLHEGLDNAITVSGYPPARDETGARTDETPLTLALSINRALAEALARHPEAVLFGEDVAGKGGVYGVTRGLQAGAGRARVFDTLLDEQAILGLALGAGVSGLLPLPEIQYLAYVHNASDQIRGEAASLQFFSDRQYRNPMVIRIAGYGYQKGFGGHFHNDNSIAALRDIPGVVIASPARPDDAAAMLRSCVEAASSTGAVCIFLEPIALYHTRDLHEDGDEGWLARYPGAGSRLDGRIGHARVHGDGTDLTLLTYGNGLRMSLRVARRLERRGIGCRTVDLRWLSPLPVDDMLREATATGRVLIVDETRRSGGVGESVLAELLSGGFAGRIARVSSQDSFIPLGDAARHVLLDEDTIEAAAIDIVGNC